MIDRDNPLAPLTSIEVGAAPPLAELQARHRRNARRPLFASAAIATAAIAVVAVAVIAPRGGGVDTISGPAVTASPPVEPDDAAGPIDATGIRFEVTPAEAQPGDTVVISGNGCPADESWKQVPGWPEAANYSVVVGAGVSDRLQMPEINPPTDGSDHLSFSLVPEYRDAQIAQSTPDDAGDWSATWTVPEPESGTDTMWLSALCIGGAGLESGFVHYGAIPLLLASSTVETTPTSTPVADPGSLPTTPLPPDSISHDPATCQLSSLGLAFYLAEEDVDVEPPPCIRAGINDRLRLINRSGQTWTVDLGETTRSIPTGTVDEFDGAQLGTFLEPGVHHLSDDVPDIWVVDPSDSPFGAVTEMTLRSFGPLRTNMTVAEAETVLGVDLVSIQDNQQGCTFVAPAGPSDPYAPALQVFGDDKDGRIVRIETSNPAISTPSGVSVGQPESTLTEIYGDQLQSSPDEYMGPDNPNYEFVPVDEADADFRLVFSTLDDTIDSIFTSTAEAAGYSEGCS